MNRLYLFRALLPTSKYPTSSLDISLNSVRYDLVLPIRVGIALSKLLGPESEFRRCNEYCTPTGFSLLRSTFRPFGANQADACYADAESRFESFKNGVLLGDILQFAAGNEAAAKTILESVIDGTLDFDVIDWIFGHAPYLDYSGGFEIVQWISYATDDEKKIAVATACGAFDNSEPSQYQPHVTQLQPDGSLVEEDETENRLSLFRALNPGAKHPKPLVDLVADGQRYDLILPNEVADSLINELRCNDVFSRLDAYCTPNGIENIQRLAPFAFDPAHEQSVYVEAIRISENGKIQTEEIALNALAAADLFRIAMDGKRFSQSVADWILNRSTFFLNRICFLQYPCKQLPYDSNKVISGN